MFMLGGRQLGLHFPDGTTLVVYWPKFAPRTSPGVYNSSLGKALDFFF